MKPSLRITLVVVLSTLAAVPTLGCPRPGEDASKPSTPTAPRDADAAELALVAPLAKGGTLLNYSIDGITLVSGAGLTVWLHKPGAFLPDGGESDGGPGCDPSHPDESRLSLVLSLVPDGGASYALIKGPYAIRWRPVNVPQSEADRLAAAFLDIVDLNAPVPASLSDASNQTH